MRIPSSAIRNRIEYIFPGKVSLALSTVEIEFPPKSSPSFDLPVSIFSLFLFTTTLPLHPLHHIYHQNSKHRPVTSSIAAKLDPSIPPPPSSIRKKPIPKASAAKLLLEKTSDRNIRSRTPCCPRPTPFKTFDLLQKRRNPRCARARGKRKKRREERERDGSGSPTRSGILESRNPLEGGGGVFAKGRR